MNQDYRKVFKDAVMELKSCKEDTIKIQTIMSLLKDMNRESSQVKLNLYKEKLKLETHLNKIKKRINSLDYPYSIILELYYLQGYSFAKVSFKLNYYVRHVRRLHRIAIEIYYNRFCNVTSNDLLG